MAVTVDVTPDGKLAITADGVQYPPLTVAAVQAANAQVTAAQNIATQQETTAAAHALVDAIAAVGSSAGATLTFAGGAVTAALNPTTNTAVAAKMDATPSPTDGSWTASTIDITATP